MNIKSRVSLPVLILIVFITTFFITPSTVFATTATVDLGNVANFAVMGAAAISDTPTSVITGDVGLWYHGGSYITGLQCIEVTGTIYDNNGTYSGNPSGTACLQTNASTLTSAHTSLTSAYNDAAGRSPTTTYSAIQDLGGLTLPSGVYNDPSSFAVTGTLTLDGGGDANSVFIFQAGSTLTMANNSVIKLTNSAQSCNVFWQVGTSATLNTSTTFVGNLLAFTSITDSGSSKIDGRHLAGSTTDNTGAVTLSKTTVTKSTCAPVPTPTPTPTLTPSPSPGSTSSPSSSTAGSTSSSSSSSNSSPSCTASTITTIPSIIETRRVSPTSIFVSWGPYAGLNDFVVQYGYQNTNFQFSTKVSGFSTTINSLPANQSIWIEVAATDNCATGTFGKSLLAGETAGTNSPGFPNTGNPLAPNLPNTGFGPDNNNVQWKIIANVLLSIVSYYLAKKAYKFLLK